MLIVWPALDLRGTFISDEGSYGVQARALDRGSWDMGYAFSGEDPDGAFVPFHAATYVDGRLVPYAAHPAWTKAQVAATDLAGEEVGLRLFGVASLLGLAVVAWHLAAELGGPGAPAWAFWMAAASPALANAWISWAHTPSAFLGGLLVLSALRHDRGPWWAVAAVVSAGGGVLIRSEGLIWAGAVATALVLRGADRRQRWGGAVVGVGAGAALVLEREWRSRILGDPASSGVRPRGEGTGVVDRLDGLTTALIDGAIASGPARALGLVLVVAMGAALVAFLRDRQDLAAGLLGLSSIVFGVRLAVESLDPAPGLLAAAPLLLMACGWRPLRDGLRWLWWAIGLYVVMIGVTIYPDGGALQWGGRFFSPLVAPLGAAGGAFLASQLRAARGHRSIAAALTGTLCLALVVQAVGAVIVPERLRRLSQDGVEQVAALGPSVVIARGTQIPRLDWRSWPKRCWISIPDGGGPDDARAVLDVLARSGVPRASYAGIDPDLLRTAGASVTEGPDGYMIGTLDIEAAPNRRIAAPYRCDG